MLPSLPKNRAETSFADAKPAYTTGEAISEANRCLYCYDAPCIKACPTEIDVPTFIRKIATGNREGAAKTIFSANPLGYSCARVCPVEVLCVGACVYNPWDKPPIEIGRLQRFATEPAFLRKELPFTRKGSTGRKVALVGAGPASLSCASYLAAEGHHAVIFERDSLPGGLNTTGVAPYKLHADEALREVEMVLSLGVELRCGVEVGKEITAESLLLEYDAVFLGLGLGGDTKLGVPGEEGPNVVGATSWIRRLRLDPTFSLKEIGRAVVIGGGNTAIDVARELRSLGVQSVVMAYRNMRSEMSGYDHEWTAAATEGVVLREHSIPKSFRRDGDLLVGVEFSGGEVLPCDFAVVAIGQSKLQRLAQQFPGVVCDSRGIVVIDSKTGATGNPKVFSGGDCTNGGKEVVNAVADGRRAAAAMKKMWEE